MRADEHEKLLKSIGAQLEQCFSEFHFRLKEDLNENTEALKANSEVGTQAIRKLDEIKNRLDI